MTFQGLVRVGAPQARTGPDTRHRAAPWILIKPSVPQDARPKGGCCLLDFGGSKKSKIQKCEVAFHGLARVPRFHNRVAQGEK